MLLNGKICFGYRGFLRYSSCCLFSSLRIKIESSNDMQDLEVVKGYLHPDFDRRRLSDDIALLELKEPIDLIQNEGVNAACLPACNNMFDQTFANKTG